MMLGLQPKPEVMSCFLVLYSNFPFQLTGSDVALLNFFSSALCSLKLDAEQ